MHPCASCVTSRTTRPFPPTRTSFENPFFTTEHLWQNLQDFATTEPPTLLWHDHGKHESLFKVLAPRFLLAPDHVLGAERIHSRWQWACDMKHSLKIQTLNASLRLMHDIENNQACPSNQDLLPHLHASGTQIGPGGHRGRRRSCSRVEVVSSPKQTRKRSTTRG